jgi:hypothetical protein
MPFSHQRSSFSLRHHALADFRETGLDEYLWKGTVGGVAGMVNINWNSTDVPLGEIYIGIGTFATAPSSWLDMTPQLHLQCRPINTFG